jgi:ribosome-binding protein aMBF1 (putative translation factor)
MIKSQTHYFCITKNPFNMKKTARTYESPILDEFIALENPELTATLATKMRLAAKIYEAMQVQNMGKSIFAEHLNVSPSLVTKWLSGQHNFTVDTLVRIERILHIELLSAEKIAA